MIDLVRMIRAVAALTGVGLLIGTGLAPDEAWREWFAGKAFVLLALAALTAVVEVVLVRRRFQSSPADVAPPAAPPEQRRQWRWAFLAVAVLAGIAVQTWFAFGKAIATGDMTPPGGTAWLDRMFTAWGGPDLGGPLALQLQLPWGAVLRATTFLHGSGADAQRVWITLLYVGAAMSTVAFLRVLNVKPVAAVLGAALFVCNPYVVSAVAPNPVYLAAMVLLPAFPAIVVATAQGRMRVRTGAVLIALGAPLLGYAYQNPPLVGVVVVALFAAIPAARWISGRQAGRRAALTAVAGAGLLLVLSVYWIVPAVAQLSALNTSLASTASWSWTEGRATVANAFWLNTAWGWIHPEYYPYAASYSAFPLSLLRFALPALAFLPLGLIGLPTREYSPRVLRRLAIVAVLAIVSLSIIFISTGNNPPGFVVFEPLYALPFGWLLREPGRFLMVVGLAYGALLAIGMDELRAPWRGTRRARRPLLRAGRRVWAALCLVVAAAVVVGPGYPIVAGAVVGDQRGYLPSAHVSMPDFWPQMAETIDAEPVAGAVLMLPAKDFYQVPFDWGFYGTDAFMAELLHRQVIAPNGQGYLAPFTQLLTAAKLVETDMLQRRWSEAAQLLQTLRAPLVLVRGDVVADQYPGRHMARPSDLASSLDASPNFRLLHEIGPLRLYQLQEPLVPMNDTGRTITTVNTTAPDLRVLRNLPGTTALVSASARPGVPRVEQLPGVEHWTFQPGQLSTSLDLPAGWQYQLYDLASPGSGSGEPLTAASRWHAREVGSGSGHRLDLALDTGPNAIADGSFEHGVWSPVGDCNVQRPGAGAGINAYVVDGVGPSGGRALRLTADDDSACESTPISWGAGPVLLRYSVRHVTGAAPRICLYEVELYRCADTPEVPSTTNWSTVSTMVTPDAGTRTLRLFFYADGDRSAGTTVADYADVTAVEFPVVPSLSVVGQPGSTPSRADRLLVQTTSFSSLWSGPAGASHVLVNGMLNGWIGVNAVMPSEPVNRLEPVVTAAAALSGLGLLLALLSLVSPLKRLRARTRSEDAT